MPDDPQLLPQTPPVILPEPEPAWRPGQEHPSWSVWDAVTIFVVFLISVMIVGGVALGIAAHLGAGGGAPVTELARDPKVIVPAQCLAYLVTVAVAYFMVRTRATSFLRAIRWDFPSSQFVGFIGAGIALSLLVQAASWLLPIPKSLPIEHLFRDAGDAWIMAVFGCTVAPLVEELLFRGILYPALARRLGMVTAVGITAVSFAALHTQQLAFAWAPVLMVLIVGVVLTLVRARTGSVAASFLIHAGYNFTIFFLVWLGTDHFRHMEKMAS